MEADGGPFVFRLNENGAGPSLLAQVCVERGWRDYSAATGDHWNLWWRTCGFPLNQYRLLKPWQFTNHIPKGSSICRKDSLARYLRCMQKVHGAIYDFTPRGFNLPLEYTRLVGECSRQSTYDENNKVWICKPVGQSQGRGIFLFRRLSELCYDNNAVVQRYIENPLLIGGYKFDLRLYVCVPSYHPLVVYVYKEGLARFGTDKFNLSDLDNPFRHLTNCSLNKLGPGYAENKERVGSGCKWTLKQLRHYFQQVGLPDWLLWQRISSLVVLTVLSQMQGIPASSNCFELYGFDVLVDSDLRPWLLEVNLSPALGNDCDVDSAVKKPMLHDMFDLLGLPVSNTGLSLFTVWSPANQDERRQPMGDRGSERKSAALTAAANRWRRKQKKSAAPSSNKSSLPSSTTVLSHVTLNQQLTSSNKSSNSVLSHVNLNQQLTSSNKSSSSVLSHVTLNQQLTSSNKSSGSVLSHVNLNQQLTSKCWTRPKTSPAVAGVGGSWGDRRDWSAPPAGEGGWSRVYPLWPGVDEETKGVVAAVHRHARAAKEIARKGGGVATDVTRNATLKRTLKMDADVWLPEV